MRRLTVDVEFCMTLCSREYNSKLYHPLTGMGDTAVLVESEAVVTNYLLISHQPWFARSDSPWLLAKSTALY